MYNLHMFIIYICSNIIKNVALFGLVVSANQTWTSFQHIRAWLRGWQTQQTLPSHQGMTLSTNISITSVHVAECNCRLRKSYQTLSPVSKLSGRLSNCCHHRLCLQNWQLRLILFSLSLSRRWWCWCVKSPTSVPVKS